MRYHAIKEWIEEGKLNLIKVHTENNAADMMTKLVDKRRMLHIQAP